METKPLQDTIYARHKKKKTKQNKTPQQGELG